MTVLVGGCTSSGETPKPADSPDSSSSATSSASATPPSSVAPSSVAPSSAAPSLPTSSAASAVPKPLSRFENDPGLKAFRTWAIEAAKTINTGHQTSTALQGLMTASFAKTMGNITGPDVGLYYPGSVPFQPVGVTVQSSTRREIRGCLMAEGFARKSRTATVPAHPAKVTRVDVLAVRQSGRWIVDNLITATDVSCKNVRIETRLW